MSLRANGSYIGPRPAGPSASVASGIWDLRTAERQQRQSAWPGISDPSFSAVTLLLHMDGSGQTFTDSSGSPKAVTANGGVTQSSDQSKFGGKSAYFDGSGDYLTFGSADLSLGSGDFTLEMWVYPTTTQTAFLADWRGSTANAPTLYMQNNVLNWYDGGAVNTAPGYTFSNNAWQHVAVCRSGTSLRFFVDGVQKGSTVTDSVNYGGSGGLRVGYHSPNYFTGYIDDLRITKGSGAARYTANFTPPAAAFPDI